MIVMVLDNASIASESAELGQCLNLWRRVLEGGGGELGVRAHSQEAGNMGAELGSTTA